MTRLAPDEGVDRLEVTEIGAGDRPVGGAGAGDPIPPTHRRDLDTALVEIANYVSGAWMAVSVTSVAVTG